MTWKPNKTLTLTVNDAVDYAPVRSDFSPLGSNTTNGVIAYDGHDVWFAFKSSLPTVKYYIGLYNHWDQSTDYEDVVIERARIEWNDTPPLWMECQDQIMYIHKSNYIQRWNVQTRTLIDQIAIQDNENVQDKFIIAHNKLWFIGTTYTNYQQKCFVYNLLTQTWSSFLIDGPAQEALRDIAYGLDGYVWITNKSQNRVLRYNADTLAFGGAIDVRRGPSMLSVDQNKTLYVSTQTTVGKVDQTALTYTPYLQGQSETYLGLSYDGDLWLTGGSAKVVRVNATTLSSRLENGGSGYDINFVGGADVFAGLVIPGFTYKRWEGGALVNSTVAPYLYTFMSTSQTPKFTSVNVFRLRAMKRPFYYTFRGTGMTSVGPYDYMGD